MHRFEAPKSVTHVNTRARINVRPAAAFRRLPDARRLPLNDGFGSLCRPLHSDPYAQVATMR